MCGCVQGFACARVHVYQVCMSGYVRGFACVGVYKGLHVRGCVPGLHVWVAMYEGFHVWCVPGFACLCEVLVWEK
jgi:hypothetical protein